MPRFTMPLILALRHGPAFPMHDAQPGCCGRPSATRSPTSLFVSDSSRSHWWLTAQICARSLSELWFAAPVGFGKQNGIRGILTMSYATDTALGDDDDEIPGPPPVYPRLNLRDPFKLLGISYGASELEIQEARTYLMDEYGRHERSREAIEAAHNKIVFASYRERKRSKINLKSNLKKKISESPIWMQKLVNMIEVPTSTIIMRRAALFTLLSIWSVVKSAEAGPAFQVAVSLGLCTYFLHERVKSIRRAAFLGFGRIAIRFTCGASATNLPAATVLES